MICPFCQRDIDVQRMACDNCGAEFPQPGSAMMGVRLRMLLLSFGVVLIGSVMLVKCGLNYLPGERKSAYRAPGSPQVRDSPMPSNKDQAVQRLLQEWNLHVQQTQNPEPAIRTRKGANQ